MGLLGLLSLYLIKNLHQTTTVSPVIRTFSGCILLKIYIKPQLEFRKSIESQGCILLKIYIKPQLLTY